MNTRRRKIANALALLPTLAALPASAQPAYPNKPIRFVVSFAPGGPADIIARLLGQKLTETLGHPVVVENRAGAGGNVATAATAKAQPDGYTLLVTTSAYAVNPSLSRNAGYDPEKDFVAVGIVAASPNILVSTPSLTFRTLQEALAEAKSGKLNYATAGAGTTPHLTAEYLFKVLAKVEVTHVPFQGGSPAVTAAAGGQVQIACVALPSAVEMVKSGRVRGLAVTGARRVASLPDVPTVAESGYPGFDENTWTAVFAPAGTPADIVGKLNAEINAILRTADFQARLAAVTFDAVGGTPADAAAFVKRELVKWPKLVRETGARAE